MKIAHIQTTAEKAVCIRHGKQQLSLKFPQGCDVSVVFEGEPKQTIGFEKESRDE